ncbi:MAG TPA: hypothetical protein VFB80_11400 [Pirellulaceae bacterium]|nr:hypothetical protein [Pirellulaceae bacterium]
MVAAPGLPRWLSLLAALSLSGLLGCAPGNVWVYIDNAGDEPLVVKVDGKEAAKIPPGEFAELNYPPGEYQFLITAGGQTVCDLKKNLEKSDTFGRTRKYLFNPDKNNCYGSYEVKYGGSRLDGVMEASLLSHQKDPKIRAKYAYNKLLKEIDLVSTDAWNDVSGVEYILSPPPETMMTRSGSSRRVTVLDRLDKDDYRRLKEMSRRDNPDDADVDELEELIDEILSKAL